MWYFNFLFLILIAIIGGRGEADASSDSNNINVPTNMDALIDYKFRIFAEIAPAQRLKIEEVKTAKVHAAHLHFLIEKLDKINTQYLKDEQNATQNKLNQISNYLAQIRLNRFDTTAWFHLSQFMAEMVTLYPSHRLIKLINPLVLRATFHVYELATAQQPDFKEYRQKYFQKK